MPEERTAPVALQRVRGASVQPADDVVVIEEPLELRVAWANHEKNISVTMRTPGDDFDLAAGFLFTEGLIRSPRDIESIRHWGSPNIVRVGLAEGVVIDTAKLDRHFYTTSSCGVCGKTSIEALRIANMPIAAPPQIDPAIIHRLPQRLREQQATFSTTGGLHAAAVFNMRGEPLRIREDIGRHNAVDKVIGSLFRDGATPVSDGILMVSSRASFELAQKAVVAGIPVLAAVGAPSSLAVDLAREFGLTLLGFVREDRFNVYAGTVE